MSKRVVVHHFVVANLVRPENNLWLASDLFHVSYWLDVPADTEFPYIVPRLQVFARFILWNARPTDFFVKVLWLDAPEEMPREIASYGPLTIPFEPAASVTDTSFTMHNLHIRGQGAHTVELYRVRKRGFRAGSLARMTSTNFYVER